MKFVAEGLRDFKRLVVRMPEPERSPLSLPDSGWPGEPEESRGIGLGPRDRPASFRNDLNVRDRQLLSRIRVRNEDRTGERSAPPNTGQCHAQHRKHNTDSSDNCDPTYSLPPYSRCAPPHYFLVHAP